MPMKFSIKLRNFIFSISGSLANVITKSALNFKLDTKKKHTIFILEDSSFSFFQVVPTSSLTHFYVLILGKKYRLGKKFYNFLNSQSTKSGGISKNQRNSKLDKFYTKPSIAQLCVSSFTSNIKIKKKDLIIEPSAGNGSFI